MFNFFGSLFHKTIISFVSFAALMGLISTPPQTITATPTSSVVQVVTQAARSSSSAANVILVSSTPSSLPIKKSSVVVPPACSVVAPQSQPQTPVAPQQPIVNTQPPNTTLCNGTYYNNSCPSGENLVCPSSGSAYCQLSQQQQQANNEAAQAAALQQQEANAQAAQQAAQQQKTNQINALTSAYNTQYNALQQEIINIKNQYYAELPTLGAGTNIAEATGEQQALLNKDNAQISQIQLQEQQLYLNYQEQVSALQ
jgi:hypothetical protein